jgi:hypothetical protein
LAKARLEFPTIVRNCSAVARGGREYHYADLSAIAEATAGVLAQHGLVLVQALEDGEAGQLCISSTLYHSSGQWLQEALTLPKPAGMQEVGSLSTYIRRYQQSSMLNLVTEDDDDGASTTGATTEPVATKAQTPASTNGSGPTHGTPERPTEVHISALTALALKDCGEEPEVFEDRIRRTMGIPAKASVAPKLLSRTMTMQAYMTVFEHYTNLKAQLTRQTPAASAHADHAQKAPASESEPAPTAEASAGSFESSSAPEAGGAGPIYVPAGTTDAEAREALVKEAMSLGIAEKEARHVVTMHKDLEKARSILTAAARRKVQAA